MNLAAQIAAYTGKGFTGEQAEVIALMRVASGVLFRDFPESFLLFGGATLLLFHDSVRHSADLDLLGRAEELPTAADLSASLTTGLASAAEALDLGPLRVEASGDHVLVKKRDSSLLFKVDITRFASVLESEVEEHAVEIEADDISRRTAQVDEKRCLSELRSLLPPTVFDALAREQFRPLRDALHELYRRWLED